MSEKCIHCGTPFGDDLDENGKPFCGCDGEKAAALAAENARLREALAFYADPGNWQHDIPDPDDAELDLTVWWGDDDGYKIARDALTPPDRSPISP